MRVNSFFTSRCNNPEKKTQKLFSNWIEAIYKLADIDCRNLQNRDESHRFSLLYMDIIYSGPYHLFFFSSMEPKVQASFSDHLMSIVLPSYCNLFTCLASLNVTRYCCSGMRCGSCLKWRGGRLIKKVWQANKKTKAKKKKNNNQKQPPNNNNSNPKLITTTTFPPMFKILTHTFDNVKKNSKFTWKSELS